MSDYVENVFPPQQADQNENKQEETEKNKAIQPTLGKSKVFFYH